jgi:hypothetical protein
LVWALESNSELQRRDISQLLAEAVDMDYIRSCATPLDVTTLRADAVNDTSAVTRSMTPAERLVAASSLFDTARKIVEASLPSGLTMEQRRLAVARRLYRNELPEAALIAHAKYVDAATPALPT